MLLLYVLHAFSTSDVRRAHRFRSEYFTRLKLEAILATVNSAVNPFYVTWALGFGFNSVAYSSTSKTLIPGPNAQVSPPTPLKMDELGPTHDIDWICELTIV